MWWAEQSNLVNLSQRVSPRFPTSVVFLIFLTIAFAYGLWAELSTGGDLVFATTLTVSLLHFWYDGFIWSVRKKSV